MQFRTTYTVKLECILNGLLASAVRVPECLVVLRYLQLTHDALLQCSPPLDQMLLQLQQLLL